jgi:hypothetical protein
MDLDSKSFSKLIRVSAHDRNLSNVSETAEKFRVGVPGYSREFGRLLASQVVSCHITHTFYNVDVYSKQFVFTTPGDSQVHTITMTEGQYSSTEYLDHLIALIDAELSSSNAYSIDQNTQKITLTFSEDIKLTPSISQNPVAVNLGFGLNEIEYASSSSIITAPYVINLAGPNSVYIHCRQLSAGTSDFDTPADVHSILEVPLDQPFGSVCRYQASDAMAGLIRYRNARSIDELEFRVRDSRGRLLNCQDVDWSIIIKIYYGA